MTTPKPCPYIAVACLLPATLWGGALSVDYTDNMNTDCGLWETLDIRYSVPEPSGNPFDTDFGAVFSGPDGQEMNVPGFYDGEATFVIRFSPPALGPWTFTTYSAHAALADNKGTVQCRPNPDPDAHGPLVISEHSPRHVSWADGAPCFLLAFEFDWLFALDLETTPHLPKTEESIDAIARNGFNHVVMNVYAHDVSWEKDPALKPEHEYGSPPAFPFGGSNDTPDHSVLNVAFFQHLDRVVRHLQENRIVAHLMIYVWNKNVNWPEANSPADNRYFDYVLARYQGFANVVWDVSKEALGYGHNDMDYITDRIRRIRKLDGHQRLVTVHDYSYCDRHPEMVDIISVQAWQYQLGADMLGIYRKHNSKPILNIEHGGYERGRYKVFAGDYTDPEVCLWRNYQCVFNGVYSTHYWQNTAWNVVIPDMMSLPEGERPNLEYFRIMAELFEDVPYHTLVPRSGATSSGFALTDEENTWLVVLSPMNTSTAVFAQELAGKTATVEWLIPLNGTRLPGGTKTLHGWNTFDNPWPGQMAVLTLRVVP